MMKYNPFHYFIFFLLSCFALTSCIWAKRCPEKSCRVSVEHKHEGGTFRSREAFSWTTTKKHWPWNPVKGSKKFNGKKDKKSGKTKFKYTLPGERVNFDK